MPVSSVKLWLLRVMLSVVCLLLMFILLEGTLRYLYANDRAKGGTLKQTLLQSKPTRLVSNVETDFGDIIRASSHSNISYELKAELDCIFRSKRVRTNTQGLRGPERPIPKPDGTFRIVGLGDSIMFGWGVDQADCYLAVMERDLNARPQPHPVYECINFGVPGYNTAIEVATLELRGLAYDPDLVIIQFVNNDFGVPSFMLRPPAQMSWRKSYFIEFLRARCGNLKHTYEDENLVYSNFRNVNEEEKLNVIKEYSYMVGPDGYKRAMNRLGELTRKRGIPVIILIGTLGPDQRTLIQEVVNTWGFSLLDIGPVTQRVLKEKGIPSEDFGKVGWVGNGDKHPNAFGHGIYSLGLIETMESMSLLEKHSGTVGIDASAASPVRLQP